MCHRGQARKGVILYNLWASAAGYVPITFSATIRLWSMSSMALSGSRTGDESPRGQGSTDADRRSHWGRSHWRWRICRRRNVAPAQKKAAQTAADTSLATNERQQRALSRHLRPEHRIASPFYNNGVAAGTRFRSCCSAPINGWNAPQPAGARTERRQFGRWLQRRRAGRLSGGQSRRCPGSAGSRPITSSRRRKITPPGITSITGRTKARAAPAVNVPAPTAATGDWGTTGGRARCVRPLPAGHQLPVAL
jgi:hypothetical protein